MDHLSLLVIAAAFLAWGLIAGRLRGTVLTGPLLFTIFGLLASGAVTGLVPLEISDASLHFLAEITLVLVLFADAAFIDLKQLRRDHNLPVRMLLAGMPLTIVLGAAAAMALFPSLSVWEAALLAAVLAPTDAALGQAVVSDKAVPVRIRQALNVESGFNDGIALPLVLVLVAFSGAMGGTEDTSQWLLFGLSQVTLGPLAGIIVGWLGARFVLLSERHGWIDETAEGVIAIALAFAAFGLAEIVHGNGFIAAFVAGLTFGNTLGRRCEFLYAFAETEGQLLTLATFGAFGCAMLPMVFDSLSPALFVYAALSLTVLRMLPVWISLTGTGVHGVTRAFLGWFGPRGLASVLFVLLIIEESNLPGTPLIEAVVIVTVFGSIVLHGLSAGPAAKRYGARAAAMGTCQENMPVPEQPFEASTAPSMAAR